MGSLGQPVKLFFCPQLCGRLQLTGPPRRLGDGSVSQQPLPFPSVPRGQEKRKHFADFLMGRCTRARLVLLGGAEPGLPTAFLQKRGLGTATPPIHRWTHSGRVLRPGSWESEFKSPPLTCRMSLNKTLALS